jgi:hypothetical protein
VGQIVGLARENVQKKDVLESGETEAEKRLMEMRVAKRS